MVQSLGRVFVHVVFATKLRRPSPALLMPTIAELNEYMAGILDNLGCPPVWVNGYLEHMHPFFVLSRTLAISRVVGELKTASTKWVRERVPGSSDFEWQRGYAAFSVSPGRVERTRKYIEGQEAHHRRKAFLNEIRGMLLKAGAEFDERLWSE
jgi:REP element-mobilizing transposase RayT